MLYCLQIASMVHALILTTGRLLAEVISRALNIYIFPLRYISLLNITDCSVEVPEVNLTLRAKRY